MVPLVIVMGRSVFGRNVKQGIPRNVVSSCNPPESVRTNRALSTSPIVSWYPRGLVIIKPEPLIVL